MKAFRGLSSGEDSFDPIEPTKDFRRGLGVFGRAKPDVAGATEGAVMLDILITLGREGEPEFSMRAYMRYACAMDCETWDVLCVSEGSSRDTPLSSVA